MKTLLPMLAGFANAVTNGVFSTVIAILTLILSCVIILSLIVFFQPKREGE
jgi:hypothetical protein